MDKSSNQLLGFVKSSEGSNRSYLLTFPDENETIRIYQNANFTCTLYAFSLDTNEVDDEIIICYDYDNKTQQAMMSFYSLQDEMIITNYTVLEEIAPATFTAKVIGELANGEQVTADFKIQVVKNFSTVDYCNSFADYWYYDTEATRGDLMQVILPIDNHRLHGNDIKLTSALPSRLNLTRTQYKMEGTNNSV